MRYVHSLLLSLCLILANCAKHSGQADLEALRVEPPVASNTPEGFTQTLSMQSSNAVNTIATRFFSSGPTNIHDLLSSIDRRLVEVEDREEELHRPCTDKETTLFSVTAPFALDFPHYLSCMDAISSTQWLGFGEKNGTWYMREGQTRGFLTLAKVDAAQNVEAWMAVADKDAVYTSSQMLMHLKSTAETHTLELTVTGSNIGVGCGVQFQSNTNYIYVSGLIDDPSGGSGVDCTTVVPSTLCADAKTLEVVSDTLCQTAELNTFTLPALNHSSYPYAQIHLFGDATLEGLSQF